MIVNRERIGAFERRRGGKSFAPPASGRRVATAEA
jgi:hypothetical protein